MPQAKLSKRTLFRQLGREMGPEELETTLFRTKMELASLDAESVTLEVTHDRPDLLSESGVSLLLEGLTTGTTRLHYAPDESPVKDLEVLVDPSVSEVRGAIAMAALKAPRDATLDADMLEELVRYQELLHASLGADRRRGSLGLYPLRHLSPPFHYTLEPLDHVRFTPLPTAGAPPSEWTGTEFFQGHDMAKRYGDLGLSQGKALTLRDASGNLLSLPPVLNSAKFGEVAPGDTAILLESTGTSATTVRQMVGYMLLPFVAWGWRAQFVAVRRADGSGESPPSPLEVRQVGLNLAKASEILGRGIGLEEARHALRVSGLSATESHAGLLVTVPPWRPDILGEADLVEEVMISLGLHTFEPLAGADATRGGRLPFSRFTRRFQEVMNGMGYQEAHTTLLLSKRLARLLCDVPHVLELANPVSEELSLVRPSLLPGLVQALASNTGEKYPQRIYELSEVVEADTSVDTGAATRTHLCAVDAGEGAGLARALAVGERLSRLAGMPAVREPAMAPGAVPGRTAAFKFAGERIATAGEIHPEVLQEMKIQEPVCWVEFDLTMIWKLKGHAPLDPR